LKNHSFFLSLSKEWRSSMIYEKVEGWWN
jgi:hypothetical protein